MRIHNWKTTGLMLATLLFHAEAAHAITTPTVVSVSTTCFTVAWNTSTKEDSEVYCGTNGTIDWTYNGTCNVDNTKLVTSHKIQVCGRTPGTTYTVAAVSKNSTTQETSPSISVTTVALASPTPSPSSSPSPRLFPSTAANWIYSAPTGTPTDISSITTGWRFVIQSHDGGYDYPVAYADGSSGYTTFTDPWGSISVPNPPGGYYPSTGSDGHLIVVDQKDGVYFDFWQMTANNGVPNPSVSVFQKGYLSGNGTPGTTGPQITGLANDILPGELDCEDCLQHSIGVIVPQTMLNTVVGTQAPAERTDGYVSGALFSEGSKIQFDPAVNVDSLQASIAVKAIMKSLQKYGGTIVDRGGATNWMGFYSSLPTQGDTTGIGLIGSHLRLYQ